MKRILAFVVALVLLAGVAPVQAQGGLLGGGYWPSSWESWYYYIRGDQVHMLQADQINWVAETLNIDRRAIRPVTANLAQSGPYVGLEGTKGFYPLYQCSSVKRRVMNGVGKTMVAAGVGYLAGRFIDRLGEREGALAGAGIGAGWALMKDAQCAPVQNKMIVIDDPSDVIEEEAPQAPPTRPRGISGRENGWNEILRARQERGNDGASWFRSSQGDCLDLGLFTLKNETGEVIRVYKNGNPYAVLKPLGVACGDPFAAYDAEKVVAISENYTARAGTPRAKPEGRSGGLWIWR